MKFIVINPFTGDRTEFDNQIEAQAKADEIRADAMVRESYRFTVAKEIVDGANTIWTNADIDGNEPDDGAYFVFNTFTGLHERVESLATAKARRAELMAEFMNLLPFISVVEEDVSAQPVTSGAQTL